MLELSYTRINAYLTCRKRYWYEYHEDLTPKERAQALMTGDIVHQLLDSYFSKTFVPSDFQNLKAYAEQAFPNNDLNQLSDVVLEAATLFNTYVQTFGNDHMMEIRSPEMHLEKNFGDFSLYSRFDGLAFLKMYDGVFRLEHKTTSRTSDIYLRGLSQGLQTGIAHWLAEELLDEPLKGSIFNLLIKTKIPRAERSAPILMNQKLVDLTKETVYGVVKSIQSESFYPSMQCTLYNKLCDFYPICQQTDTPNKRSELYTSRKEVKAQASKLNLRLYDDVDASAIDQNKHKHITK